VEVEIEAVERCKSVRVRWIDHKCKVNSDEFDREESYLRAKHL